MKQLLSIFLILALAIGAALVATAQTPFDVTRVASEQIRGMISATGLVWVTKRDGVPSQALLGENLELDESTPGVPPVLNVVGIEPGGGGTGLEQVYGEVPDSAGDAEGRRFTLDNAFEPGTLRVYRNGLRLGFQRDYTLPDGQTIEFVAYYANRDGDQILVDYAIQP